MMGWNSIFNMKTFNRRRFIGIMKFLVKQVMSVCCWWLVTATGHVAMLRLNMQGTNWSKPLICKKWLAQEMVQRSLIMDDGDVELTQKYAQIHVAKGWTYVWTMVETLKSALNSWSMIFFGHLRMPGSVILLPAWLEHQTTAPRYAAWQGDVCLVEPTLELMEQCYSC